MKASSFSYKPATTPTTYLGSSAIRALASSMALASSVLGFEMVEVWSEAEDGTFHCTYVHAEEGIVEKYPNIITGYYPQHKRKHLLSPKLCELARRSPEHYHWRTMEHRKSSTKTTSESDPNGIDAVYDLLSFPVLTEMCFELSGATFPLDMPLASTGRIVGERAKGCFLVGISVEKIDFKPYKLKFLSGIAVAIFVAAFDLDAEDDDRALQDSLFNSLADGQEGVNTRRKDAISGLLSSTSNSGKAGNSPRNNSQNNSQNGNSFVSQAGHISHGTIIHNTSNNRITNPITTSSTINNALKKRTSRSSLDDSGLGHRDYEVTEEHQLLELDRRYSSESSVGPIPAFYEQMGGAVIETVDAAATHDTNVALAAMTLADGESSVAGGDAVMSAEKMHVVVSVGSVAASNHRPFSSAPVDEGADSDDNGSHSDSYSQTSSHNHNKPTVPTRAPAYLHNIPAWDPARPFHFPVTQIPVKYSAAELPTELILAGTAEIDGYSYSFSEVVHIADGSHAHVFSALLTKMPLAKTQQQQAQQRGGSGSSTTRLFSSSRLVQQRVILKMLTEHAVRDRVACQEFAVEFGTLARLQHPHVIQLLGAGHSPRPFLVLEHLSGGTLHSMLSANNSNNSAPNYLATSSSNTANASNIIQQINHSANSNSSHQAPHLHHHAGGNGSNVGTSASSGLSAVNALQRLFRRPSFTYKALLQTAVALAEALDYCHHRAHPQASILHRDLKPDNIGFTKDGRVKVFDFGLSTCIYARKHNSETFQMTGYTGSLRYMAPEVVLRQPYNEACDVYSFAIVLWQMARDKTPFKGLSKEEFIQRVVHNHERPKLDKSWPPAFAGLLTRCWDAQAEKRPSFSVVLMELRALMGHETAATAVQSYAYNNAASNYSNSNTSNGQNNSGNSGSSSNSGAGHFMSSFQTNRGGKGSASSTSSATRGSLFGRANPAKGAQPPASPPQQQQQQQQRSVDDATVASASSTTSSASDNNTNTNGSGARRGRVIGQSNANQPQQQLSSWF